MRLRSRVAALAATLPLVLGVVGCADDAAVKPKTSPTKPTAAPLKAAPPLRLSNASFMPAMNKANKKVTSVEATARVSTAGQVFTMKVAQTIKPFAMRMDMATPDGLMKIIVVKDAMYGSTPDLPAGKYEKVDLTRGESSQMAALAQLADSADPTKAFGAWNKAGLKVKFVKSETLGFRKVDRYQVTVDTKAVLAASGTKVPKGEKVPKTIAYTVWMGADNLPYKLHFAMGGMDLQMTMTGYNAVGTITAPPASKIVKKR